MFSWDMKQWLSVLVTVVILNPAPLPAATATAVPARAVLGSISSSGTVRVGELAMAAEGTLFAGDQVQTQAGSAVIQYRDGARIVLGNQSQASFSASRIDLEKGLLSFRSPAGGKLAFAASTLRLEPATANSAANITLENRRASVAVTEGSVTVVDPSGIELVSLKAGEARLFEEAAAASPAPAAAAAPQGAGGGSKSWLIALGVGVVGVSLGIAGLVRANDADSRADDAQALATQLQSQNAALQTQLTTLRGQLATLSAQAAALSSFVQGQDALLRQLAAALSQLEQLERQLSSLQGQINQAISSGNTSALPGLVAQQGALLTAIQGLTNTVNGINQQLQNTPRPPGVSPIIP